MAIRITNIQVKRADEATWTSLNPILLDGEIGFERDTNKIKVGNGVDNWNTLEYINGSGGGGGGYTQEEIEDIVNSLIVAGTGLSKVYSDGSNTLTLSISDEVYTTAEKNKVANISVSQAVNLDTIESDSALNNAHRAVITGNPHAVTKTEISLGNVDNTSDVNKPVSIAQQAALDLKTDLTVLAAHTANTSNPHAVSKAQVNLGNVDNTSDVNKPISNATQAALDTKVESVNGITDTNIVLDPDDLDDTSTTNKFITAGEKTQISTNATDISDLVTEQGIQDTAIGLNTTHRGVTTGNPHNVISTEVPITPSGNLAATNVSGALFELQSDIDTINNGLIAPNYQTGTTYTPVLSDSLIPISLNNASPVVVTIPNNSTVAFPVNTLLNFWHTGDGIVRTNRQLGVTCPDLRTLNKYGTISIIKTGTNTWIPYGLGGSSEIYIDNKYTTANSINDSNEANSNTGITNSDGLTTLTVETSDVDLGTYALRIEHIGGTNTSVNVYASCSGLLVGQAYTVKIRCKRLVGSNWGIMLDDANGWTTDNFNASLSGVYAEYTLTGIPTVTNPSLRFYGTSGSDTGDVFLISSVVITQN